MIDTLLQIVPSAGTIVAVVFLLWAFNRFFESYSAKHLGTKFRNQMIMVGLTFVGLLIILLVVPLGDERRGQLLSLLGILLSAAIALSSTTLLGNGMAGLMLKAVRNFRTGDFILCGGHFGRVTERGLIHTEIQNENRQLTTLPNLYLVTHPLTHIRPSGTIVATTLSLGYDVSRARIEEWLLEAAKACGLKDPFVHIKELGDFSVTYRVAGLLAEVKNMITMESRLRGSVLDALHGDGIEIVSPTFMNQRVHPLERTFIPEASPRTAPQPMPASTPEQLVFDKAEEAEVIDALRERRTGVMARIDQINSELKKVDKQERDTLSGELSRLESTAETLKRVIELREKRSDDK